MISFTCDNCGRHIRVAPEQAGRNGHCPGCKSLITVPSPELVLLEEPPAPSPDPDREHILSQFAHTHSQTSRFDDATEEKPKRRLPAAIDVFLYPFSISGVANLCIFWFLPILLAVIPPVWLAGIVLAIAQLIVAACMYYYLLECVRDSAAGGIRAPENLSAQPSLADVRSVVWQMVVSVLVFWGPLIIFFVYTDYVAGTSPHPHPPNILTSPIFWATLAWGIVFFPVGILAMAMMDPSEALKPWLWLSAIVRAPLSYCGLLFACAAMAGLLFLTGLLSEAIPLLGALMRGVDICLIMTLSHLIGRFYYLNAEKIAWDL